MPGQFCSSYNHACDAQAFVLRAGPAREDAGSHQQPPVWTSDADTQDREGGPNPADDQRVSLLHLFEAVLFGLKISRKSGAPYEVSKHNEISLVLFRQNPDVFFKPIFLFSNIPSQTKGLTSAEKNRSFW